MASVLALMPATAAAAQTNAAPAPSASALAFVQGADAEFRFDTGVLSGKLRAAGKSLGLTEVVHVPTGARIDRSNGLLGHYRVFSRGVRYGPGAWDWPSTSQLQDDGAVAVHWPAATGRPFALDAVYRWIAPETVEVQTAVRADTPLAGFEVFLASYFDPAFTNAGAWTVSTEAPAAAAAPPRFIQATPDRGQWLMFPRDAGAVRLIQDGRWRLEPNPVDWILQPAFARPMAIRRAPALDLTATFRASPGDCFALAMPHQAEGHYSLYLSMFGRDVAQGGTLRARAWLTVRAEPAPSAPVSGAVPETR
jgi:hypothetical protein